MSVYCLRDLMSKVESLYCESKTTDFKKSVFWRKKAMFYIIADKHRRVTRNAAYCIQVELKCFQEI